MYQTQSTILVTEENLKSIYKSFKGILIKYYERIEKTFNEEMILGEDDNSEYDMNVVYEVSNMMYWNDPKNLGKKCMIIQKNSKIAVVKVHQGTVPKDPIEIIQFIYRLQDLTPTEETGIMMSFDGLMN